MSRLYLITGFLGAGKTTFLKNMLTVFPNTRIHVIVNEFGKEGVDGELLRETGAALDEINNGSIFCACRLDKFEEVLIRTLSMKPDIVIVEASGLSDPTNVKKILNRKEKFPNVEYRGSICLVDARQFLKVYETATVVKKQLHVSDMILLNKTDLASEEQICEVRAKIQAHRPDIVIHETVYGKLEREWLEAMEEPAESIDGADIIQSADITFRKHLLSINEDTDLQTLENFLKMIMDDTFRIKGFVYVQREWYLINCVGNLFKAEKCKGKREKQKNLLVVLSGYGLPIKQALRKAMEWYPEVVKSME